MKRIIGLLLVVALPFGAFTALAQDPHAGHRMDAGMKMEGKKKSVTGEVVDTGCYLGHAARGQKHVSCAAKCIDQGMPVGLLTSNGTLYLLTLNHDNADPYNKLKEMPGRTVTVTGTVMTRAGMKAIDVSEFKPATASASR